VGVSANDEDWFKFVAGFKGLRVLIDGMSRTGNQIAPKALRANNQWNTNKK